MAESYPLQDSKLTLLQVFQYTMNSKFKNRFDYRDRDVLKTVQIIEKKVFDKKEKKIKETYYQIKLYTSSFPQYGKYITGKSGNKQRKYKHTYYGILELQELKINSKFRLRLGSEKKWNRNPPSSMLQSISKSERERIRNQVETLMRGKAKKLINEEYKKRMENRKKQGIYLDVGDYNARVNGINGDFYFRLSAILQKFGCLYGRGYNDNIPEDVTFPFLPKHTLRAVVYLFEKNILKLK